MKFLANTCNNFHVLAFNIMLLLGKIYKSKFSNDTAGKQITDDKKTIQLI